MEIDIELLLTNANESPFFVPELELAPAHLAYYGHLQRAEQMLEEAELAELTLELLVLRDQAELDQFFGKVVKSISRAAKKVANIAAPVVSAAASVASRTPLGTLARAGYGALAAAAKGDHIFKGAAKALASDPLLRAALTLGGAVVRGENLLKAAKQAVNAGIGDLREAMRFAAMVAPFVPGIGSGVAAALGAANALSFVKRTAAGDNLAKAALSTAGGAVMTRIDRQGGNILATLKGKGPAGARAPAPR